MDAFESSNTQQEDSRASSSPEISSDEEILFKGRRPRKSATALRNPPTKRTVGHSTTNALQQRSQRPRSRKEARKRARSLETPPHDAAAVDDYISNVQPGVVETSQLKNEPKDFHVFGDHDSWRPDVGIRHNKVENRDAVDAEEASWQSTSSDENLSIHGILDRRERQAEVQYLVARSTSSVVDAEWLPRKILVKKRKVARLLRNFDHADQNTINPHEIESSDESLLDAEQIECDYQAEVADAEDEQHLEDEHVSRMTDEQMAQRLSKQEELGLDSDRIYLFNGQDPGHSPHHDGLKTVSLRRKNRRQRLMNSLEDDHISVAALTGQEVSSRLDANSTNLATMSLDNESRFHNPEMPPTLSDSELDQKLRQSWTQDRAKKKIKKQEREKMRALGLLGGRKNPRALEKYAGGISPDELELEVRNFLQGTDQTLPLPPMPAHARKTVHEICHKLAIKSRSAGSGNCRFPVLYKTSRTKPFDDRVFVQMNGRFQSRRGKREKPLVVPKKLQGHNVKGLKGGFYRDGEVVGALAPELGHENRGRAMLEKMGWSTGSGLGSLNNRGIPAPVAQVMRTSRAGLG